MVTKNDNTNSQCPFWSADSMKCSLCNGGLFIPLDDHIDVYCKTSDYSQCLQYSLHSGKQLEILEKSRKGGDNRRKYLRIFANYKVTLEKLIGANEGGAHFSTVVETLDVSKGGMRLSTKMPLTNDTMIEFSFDDSFPENLQKGTGQVTWCNKQMNESGYQAGISFHEDHIAQAISNYLG